VTWHRSFYDSSDIAVIHRFVEHQWQESVHLEFKTLANGRTFEKNDRQNPAQAISGFANAEGGIIVWGIECKPYSNGCSLLSRWLSVDLRSYISTVFAPFGQFLLRGYSYSFAGKRIWQTDPGCAQ